MTAQTDLTTTTATLANSKVRDLHRFGQAGSIELPVDRSVRMPSLQKNAG